MTGFTAGEVLAIIGGFVTIITALSVGVVNVIVALRTTAKVDQTLVETKQVASKVEQVHVLTNSNLAAVKAELALATAQIHSLRDLVQDLRAEREKAVFSQAWNTPVASPLAVVPVLAPPIEETLKKIEHHTEATAENTAHVALDKHEVSS